MEELTRHEIRDAANRLLSRRDYSIFEFTQKLLAKGFAIEEVQILIDELRTVKLLDDLRFAQNFSSYQFRRGKGENWIRHALRQKGIEEAKIDLAFRENFNWDDKILELISVRKLDFSDAKQQSKSYRFLLGRGYTYEQIHRAIKTNSQL